MDAGRELGELQGMDGEPEVIFCSNSRFKSLPARRRSHQEAATHDMPHLTELLLRF